MNPVLLKPEADTRSQVVVAGVARRDLTETRLAGTSPAPVAGDDRRAYDRVAAEHELVLLEGAGSPAEINLPDLVNNRMLQHADASALLVVDIDRGGAFAHLYGTWSLGTSGDARSARGATSSTSSEATRRCSNPGRRSITERTGMAMAGVLPMLQHDCPTKKEARSAPRPRPVRRTVAVVRYPYASNLDELRLVPHAARTAVGNRPQRHRRRRPRGAPRIEARCRGRRRGCGGSTSTLGCLAFAASGGRVLGLCGGAMVLGTDVRDACGRRGRDDRPRTASAVDGDGADEGDAPANASSSLDSTQPWAALTGLRANGYEIRNGTVDGNGCEVAPLVWRRGSVLATTVHGLLEDPDVVQHCAASGCGTRSRTRSTSSPTRSRRISTPVYSTPHRRLTRGGLSACPSLRCRLNFTFTAVPSSKRSCLLPLMWLSRIVMLVGTCPEVAADEGDARRGERVAGGHVVTDRVAVEAHIVATDDDDTEARQRRRALPLRRPHTPSGCG